MSRYSGYPRWMLLTKAAILAIFIPVASYLMLCNTLELHYQAEMDRYDNAALAISEGWPELVNFNDHSICMTHRYLDAGRSAIDHPTFDAWWLIKNWNTNFLEQQPPCK